MVENPEDIARRIMSEFFEARGQVAPYRRASKLLDRWSNWSRGDIPASELAVADEVLSEACFDVDELAENHLGISLAIAPLHHLDGRAGARVFGYALPRSKRITICERAEVYMPLYRATMLHETGHVVLHSESHFRTAAYSPHSPKRPRHELDADAFMCAAILPAPVLWLAVFREALARDANPLDAVATANSVKGRYQWRRLYLPAIVDRLCVSTHLTAVTLVRSKVFSRDTMKYHLESMLPNRWMSSAAYQPLRRTIAEIRATVVQPSRGDSAATAEY